MILIGIFPFFSSKPAKNAKIILEDSSGRNLIAFQKTGEKGKVTFKHLDEGSFRMILVFPQLEGKWLKEKTKHSTLAKVDFNPKTKTYFYKGVEGYFSIKFSGVKKIDNEAFNAVFREKRGGEAEENEIIISEFLTKRNGAKISVIVRAITAGQFKKFTDKIENDISMISIPGF